MVAKVEFITECYFSNIVFSTVSPSGNYLKWPFINSSGDLKSDACRDFSSQASPSNMVCCTFR